MTPDRQAVHDLVTADLRRVTRRLPGQTTEDQRRLLVDAWEEGLRTGLIRPVPRTQPGGAG